MNEIRQISTPAKGHKIAFAEFEKVVQIFDIKEYKVVSEFDTILDFGGRRLSISENGEICICGCWSRYGICAYETKTGKLLWQRKDLKKVQNFQTLFSNEKIIFAQFEVGSSRFLDINTGEDLEKMISVKHYYESQFEEIVLLDRFSKFQIICRETKKVRAEIEKKSFGTLDIAFAPNKVLISESGGPINCYETSNGKLIWGIQSNSTEHYLNLAYNENLNNFLGIYWPYFSGGDKILKYLNPENGIIEKEISINCPAETKFTFNGELLITSNREFIDIKTGKSKNWA